jgi:preprotein translocase subunit SecD
MSLPSRRDFIGLACLGLVAPFATARPDEKKVVVEFRIAEREPADGLTEMTVIGTKDKVFVPKRAVASNADIAKASAGVDAASNPCIDVVFSDTGAKKMAVISEKNRDKLLAILIDGKVVSAPRIIEKFSDRAQITGKFTKEDVEKLVQAINAK